MFSCRRKRTTHHHLIPAEEKSSLKKQCERGLQNAALQSGVFLLGMLIPAVTCQVASVTDKNSCSVFLIGLGYALDFYVCRPLRTTTGLLTTGAIAWVGAKASGFFNNPKPDQVGAVADTNPPIQRNPR